MRKLDALQGRNKTIAEVAIAVSIFTQDLLRRLAVWLN